MHDKRNCVFDDFRIFFKRQKLKINLTKHCFINENFSYLYLIIIIEDYHRITISISLEAELILIVFVRLSQDGLEN